jgi:hypothetical protein
LGCQIGERIGQIEDAEISAARDHCARDLGKKEGVSAGITVGPIYQSGKKKERVPVQGRDEAGPWARSGRGLKGLPRPFNSFAISFSISFLFFFCYFAKHFQIDFKQLLKLVIYFPSVC